MCISHVFRELHCNSALYNILSNPKAAFPNKLNGNIYQMRGTYHIDHHHFWDKKWQSGITAVTSYSPILCAVGLASCGLSPSKPYYHRLVQI